MAGAYMLSSPPRAPRFGLVASLGGEAGIRERMRAVTPEGEDPFRWAGPFGFSWNPYDCSSATAAFRSDCGFNPAFTESAWPSVLANASIGIWDAVKCSNLGRPADDDMERARQKLLGTTSLKVESEMWKGVVAKAMGLTLTAQYLAFAFDIQLNTGTATAYTDALADLQHDIASRWAEQRAFIYATPRTVALWFTTFMLRRENGLILDEFDNVVVPMAGGDGSSPAAVVPPNKNTAWAYATSQPDVFLSDIVVDHVVDQTNNVDMAVATRMAGWRWDCGVVGVNVDHTTVT